MDYREQANLMQRDAEEFDGPGYIIGDLRQGAKSITDLLARAEAAEARAEKAEREREEYFNHLKGLCFCCGHKKDGFDCHTKCFGHKRGSAWVYAGPRKEE